MKKNLTNHVLKYVGLITGGLVIYFLTMVALGLEHNFGLRTLNAVILASGVFLAIREFKQNTFDTRFSFLSGMGVGFMISLMSAIAFAAFIGLYLVMHPAFLAEIQATEPQGQYMNEVGLSLLIFIEALASGILFSYGSMQYLKNQREWSTS
ncbi:MAG: DUF4199 domain-containing protein [Bacteroidota bacterium]